MTDLPSNPNENNGHLTSNETAQQKDNNDNNNPAQQSTGGANEAETSILEELSIDDSLPLIDRVIRYCTSSIALQRLVHVKMLGDAALHGGYELTRDKIIPELNTIANDNEWVVRQHLGEQLTSIAKVCVESGGEKGYHTNIESILPLLKTLLVDHQEEVRLATGASLVSIAEMMSPVDRGVHILTIVLHLAHNDEMEQLRITAAQLLNSLVVVLGHDLCKQFVTPEMVALAEDPVFRVRKAAAFNMDKICLVAGEQDVTDRLLPAYIRLTKDDIYRVRKACAESLVDLSKAINSDLRSHIIVEMFLRLSTDTNKFVRNTTLQQLGPFIATLSSNEIGHDLLELYISMATYNSGDISVDNDARFWCAFNIPAVVYTLGPQRWEDIRHCFNTLFNDRSNEVRRSLACSLHEVAKIVSQKMKLEQEKKNTGNTDNDEIVDYMNIDILPKFESFLIDTNEIRSGLLRHIAAFLSCLDFEVRQKYIYILQEMAGVVSMNNMENFDLSSGNKHENIINSTLQNENENENSNKEGVTKGQSENEEEKKGDENIGEITTQGTTTKKEIKIGGGGNSVNTDANNIISSPVLQPSEDSFRTLALSQGRGNDSMINIDQKYMYSIDQNDWRTRQQLAQQLITLVTLFRKEYCMTLIAPIIFELLQDNTHIVRKAAFPALVSLIEVMGSDEIENDSKLEEEDKSDDKPKPEEQTTRLIDSSSSSATNVQDDEMKNENYTINEENNARASTYQDFIIKQFISLAQHDSFYRRQDFIDIAFLLAGSDKFGSKPFVEKVLPYLIPLAVDPVSNTRIVLSRNLVETCPKWLIQNSDFRLQLLKPLVEEGGDTLEVKENIVLLKEKHPKILEPLLRGKEEEFSQQEGTDSWRKGDFERESMDHTDENEYFPRAGRRLSEGSHSHHEIEVDVLPDEIADQETTLHINSPFSYTRDEEFMDMDAVLEEKLRLSLDKEHIESLLEQGEGDPTSGDVSVEREESLQDVEEREAKLKEIELKLSHSHDDIDDGEQHLENLQRVKKEKVKASDSSRTRSLSPVKEEILDGDRKLEVGSVTDSLQQIRLGENVEKDS